MLVIILLTIAVLALCMSAIYWCEVRTTCERCVYQTWHCPRCRVAS